MKNLLDVVSSRLKELFADETDAETASKLLMTQGNLNKIKNGKQTPSLDTLRLISEKYHVSVDWILGLKDDRDVNAINVENLDYSQVFEVMDRLQISRTIIPARITELIKSTDDENDSSDENADEGMSVSTEGVDYDLLRINDPVLSFMLRRRVMLRAVDQSLLDDWKEKHLPEYQGLQLLEGDDSMKEYMSGRRTGDSDGDWSTSLAEYINKKKKEKGGKDE
jgi:transcriptional regulator with XRE-family HTH domain